MSIDLNQELPDVLANLRSRPLFVMQLEVRPILLIGGPAGAYRRVGVVSAGSFRGDRLSGVETEDPRYDWLNRLIAIGIGGRTDAGPLYSVFEVV